MGILKRMFARAPEKRDGLPGWLAEQRSIFGWDSSAGVNVTPDNAESVTAVMAAIKILSESVAALPLIVYHRLPNGGKERATSHPLYNLLHLLPNPEITSMEMRDAMMGHLAGWGNAYAEIVHNPDGTVRELWPLLPNQMELWRQVDGSLIYRYTLPESVGSGTTLLAYDRVLQIRNRGNGWVGYSPIKMARQAIGLAMATQDYGARFFSNGARAPVVLTYPGTLGEDAYKNIQNSWNSEHQGLENSHRVAILEEGMKVENIGIPPDDAQFLETRKFQVSEIARIFRVPPHMLADLDRATFSNIEQQSLEFVQYTLMPWLVRWEQGISRCLMLPWERGQFYAEHLVDGLLRGDTLQRYTAYQIAVINGWMNRNEVREKENLNPMPGLDEFLVPMNMAPAGDAGQPADGAGQSGDGGQPVGGTTQPDMPVMDPALMDGETLAARSQVAPEARAAAFHARQRLVKAYRRVFKDTFARVMKKEVAEVLQGARAAWLRRDVNSFDTWQQDYFRAHQKYIQRQMQPMAHAYAELVAQAAGDEIGTTTDENKLDQWVKAYVEDYAARHTAISSSRIMDIVQRALAAGEDPVALLEAELPGWEEKRPADIAQVESVRQGNAVAKFIFTLAGIKQVRWHSSAGSCPFCKQMDGKVVGIEQVFMADGASLAGGEGQPEFKAGGNIGHPPLHDGCECSIGAD